MREMGEEVLHSSGLVTPAVTQSRSYCGGNTFISTAAFTSVQVVEELLSRSGALGKDTAKSIADAAMLEVASISVGHMVRKL